MAKGKETREKPWQKPELIVLVRNHPEEAVLTVCKAGLNTSAPGTDFVDCRNIGPAPDCSTCDSFSLS
jgi:hypothetical protein